MKNKIIVSLLLILLLALSASAVSASEDATDTITETSDTSDIELINEDVTDAEAISEDLDEETALSTDENAATEELGNGGVTIQNTVKVDTLSQFKTYVGSDSYDPGTIYKLNDTVIFNLTEAQNIKRSCTITGGTIKAENLDCFFNIESPANGGPNNVTIKNTKFLIKKKKKKVIFANGINEGINHVINIAGITLENITLEIADGVSTDSISLLYLNVTPTNNLISNEITITGNELNGAHSINIGNIIKDAMKELFYDTD